MLVTAAQRPDDELGVGALGKDVQEIGRRHKVEAREGYPLGLKVVLHHASHTALVICLPLFGGGGRRREEEDDDDDDGGRSCSARVMAS